MVSTGSEIAFDWLLINTSSHATHLLPLPFFLNSELDIMFNIEKAHFILEEMVTNGQIVTTNRAEVLKPILLLEKTSAK